MEKRTQADSNGRKRMSAEGDPSAMSGDKAGELEPLDREALDWAVRFAAGKARPADLAALKQWAARSPDHAAAFDRASLLWKAAGPAGRELLSETNPSPLRGGSGVGGLGRRAFLGGALAATAAGVAVMVARPPLDLWPSVSELRGDYRTGTGEQRRIVLSDHISIALNTRTSIAVGEAGGEIERISLIAGETAISTAAGNRKSLVVSAGDGRTTSDSDARFNLLAEDRFVCVTCVEGKIQVEHRADGLQLSAGQQARYSDRGLSPAVAVNSALVTAWQNGIVIFQATPVKQVVAEVNRYRPGRVILRDEALGRRLFNARLRIEKIDLVIGQIAEVFGAKTITLPGGIVLLG
jgi:transmembrane sensor